MHARAPTRLLVLVASCLAWFGSTTLAAISRPDSQVNGNTNRLTAQLNVPLDRSEGFTIMLATYRRDQNLPLLLKHLTTEPPPSLRQIVIIWQNIGVELPDFLSTRSLETYAASGVRISVRKSRKNSMNERFRPLVDWDEDVKTRVVMIMDDDIVLRRETLEWGYHEFVTANEYGSGRVVGFTGRDVEHKDGEWQYTLRPKETYSMVLSNAAWLRRKWLKKYWEDSVEMQSLRDYVDKVFNCDDILINYIVSNVTGNPPLLLQPKTQLRIIGGDGMFARGSVAVAEDGTDIVDDVEDDKVTGIPTASHFEQRKLCLSHYFDHFSQFAPPEPRSPHFPLVKTRTTASQDVEDHSRWLFRDEPWEPLTGWKLAEPQFHSAPIDPHEGDVDLDLDGDDESDLDIDRMLDQLSEEEIEDLLRDLEEERHRDGGAEDDLEDLEVADGGLFDEEDDDDDGGWHRPIERDEL